MMGPIRGADYGGKKRTINILLNTSIDLHTFLHPSHASRRFPAAVSVFSWSSGTLKFDAHGLQLRIC